MLWHSSFPFPSQSVPEIFDFMWQIGKCTHSHLHTFVLWQHLLPLSPCLLHRTDQEQLAWLQLTRTEAELMFSIIITGDCSFLSSQHKHSFGCLTNNLSPPSEKLMCSNIPFWRYFCPLLAISFHLKTEGCGQFISVTCALDML